MRLETSLNRVIIYIPTANSLAERLALIKSCLNNFQSLQKSPFEEENITFCHEMAQLQDYCVYYGGDAIFFLFIDGDHDQWVDLLRMMRLKKESSLSPVAVFCHEKNPQFEKRLYRLGITEFHLGKDLNLKLFEEVLKHALSKKKFVDDYLKKKKRQDDYLSIVSHDLKTPLSVIYSYMEILLRNNYIIEAPSEVKKKIQRSRENAETALKIVTSLLDEARLNKSQKLYFDFICVNDVIKWVIEDLEVHTKQKNLKINLAARRNYSVFADHRSMVQLFNNLITNAIKFSPTNSEINITITAIERQGRRTRLSNYVKITVEDFGMGIPADKLQAVFAPYEQASQSNPAQGTGLGLNICQKICAYHRGVISVNSTVGKGSTFTTMLPSVIGRDRNFQREKVSILIIDPHDHALREIMRQIELESFPVDGVHSVEEGIELLKSKEYTAILVNLAFQDKSKEEILATLGRVRRNTSISKTAIFILSPLIHESDFYEALMLADGHIQKPFNPNEFIIKLSSTVSTLISSKKVIAPPPQSPSSFKKLKALLVDDCIDNQEIITYFFQQMDVPLSIVGSGKLCLESVNNQDYDLILMDIEMPVMNGYKTTQKIREREKEKKSLRTLIYACSANSTQIEKNRAINSGCDGFLEKPLNFQKLKNVLYEACERTASREATYFFP